MEIKSMTKRAVTGRWRQQVILITGASSGIGAALGRQLASEGAWPRRDSRKGLGVPGYSGYVRGGRKAAALAVAEDLSA